MDSLVGKNLRNIVESLLISVSIYQENVARIDPKTEPIRQRTLRFIPVKHHPNRVHSKGLRNFFFRLRSNISPKLACPDLGHIPPSFG